uniref:Uncharacterized protein n=1 Tax=Oryza sativa subsp. japonica TaxID=39947 RepID=Q69LQ4_ORYSJ|nr:hypothetical protein [Oryza sativa Japonica Group]
MAAGEEARGPAWRWPARRRGEPRGGGGQGPLGGGRCVGAWGHSAAASRCGGEEGRRQWPAELVM